MQQVGRIVVLGMLLSGTFILPGVFVESAQARCCSTDNGRCTSASEIGCVAGGSMNMFFANPCECDSGSCIDPTQGDSPCGGAPPDQCGNYSLDSGEECDGGPANGTFASCCTMDCKFKSGGAICDDGTFCDGLGVCDNSGMCSENTGPTCPDPERCNEEERTCGGDAPTVSTPALVALALSMLAGALLMLRRRRLLQ